MTTTQGESKMDQRIIALIAGLPMLRASQIADRLDLEVDQVDTLLRRQLVAGNVVEHEVTAPNGRPAMAYELSEQFKASDALRTMMAGSEAPALLEASALEPVPAPEPKPHDAAGKRLSKVDRAIAFLTKNGSANAAQLREVMGLQPKAAPSSWLTVALKSGQIVNEGGVYTLRQAEAPSPAAEPRESAPRGPMRDCAPMNELKGPLADPVPAPSKPPRCRFAVWSDGKVEIKAPGHPSLELSSEEFDDLVDFVRGGA
jgi:hypothetical protein